MNRARPSLLTRIWLSTSVLITLLFLIAGYVMQREAEKTSLQTVETEMTTSFQAYEALWNSRSQNLAAVSAVISSMPNVRDALGTRHSATIRDAAAEVWQRISENFRDTSFLVVTSPEGETIAPLSEGGESLPHSWSAVRSEGKRFPKQVRGFQIIDEALYQLVLTPVYVDAAQGQRVLISVLVSGFAVGDAVAKGLQPYTGGSEVVFTSGDVVYAATLDAASAARLVQATNGTQAAQLSDGAHEYLMRERGLMGVSGAPIGELRIFRALDGVGERLAELRTNLLWLWLAAVAGGLGASFLLARRIVQPVAMLDRAASEVARGNLEVRVPEGGSDELGRLAASFNSMSRSLANARQELIRHERISTIGRMASSIVHDLRNPLAAIYGGAEMMVDTDLSPEQVRRVASNIYRSSRRIQEMLQELLEVTRGKNGEKEVRQLAEVVAGVADELGEGANAQGVTITMEISPDLELPLERGRVERVFQNLIGNALEAMPNGGEVAIRARRDGDSVRIDVADSGPGISPEVRGRLFQPFATSGKRGGLGLGLALARQTVLDQGGDLWEESQERGAHFVIRLPLTAPELARQATR
jgi:signal transduction histidine kinase